MIDGYLRRWQRSRAAGKEVTYKNLCEMSQLTERSMAAKTSMDSRQVETSERKRG